MGKHPVKARMIFPNDAAHRRRPSNGVGQIGTNMSALKKKFLIVFALFIIGLNFVLYFWHRSLEPNKVGYMTDLPVVIAFDKQGRIWTYGEGNGSRGEWYSGGKLRVYENGVPILTFSRQDSPILVKVPTAITFDDKGQVWIASFPVKDSLAVYDGVKWETIDVSPNDSRSYSIEALAVDSNGRIWVGSHKDGLKIYDGQTWMDYTTENSGLSSNNIASIAFDRLGRAWIGTRGNTAGTEEGGLSIFDGQVWETYVPRNSPLRGFVSPIVFDQQDRAWMGSSTGIHVFDGENWISFTDLSDAGIQTFDSIAVDGQGKVWVMKPIDQGILVFNGRSWEEYPDYFSVFSLFDGWVGGSMAVDGDGNIWIPTKDGVVSISTDSRQSISRLEGVLNAAINSGGLIYMTIFLIGMWLCFALNAWRTIGFGLVGLPVYIGWIAWMNPGAERSFFYLSVNPGTYGTIGGIIGGLIGVYLERSGKKKAWMLGWIGLLALLIVSSLCITFMRIMMRAQ